MRIIVIGGGPGGYVAAIKAAQLGADVTLVEQGNLGGTCLNRGCIPAKTLLHATGLYESALNSAAFGVEAKGVTFHYDKAKAKKDAVVAQLVGGVGMLLKKNGVAVVKGTAKFVDGKTIAVTQNGTTTPLTADRFVIATGSEPLPLPIPGCDLPDVLDSTQALDLTACPKSIVIVGGGVIGAEFATIFAAAGAEVTILEMLPSLVATVDSEIADLLKKELEKKKITLHLSSALKAIKQTDKGLEVHFERDGKAQAVKAEKVLISIGRRSCTDGVGLEGIGVKLDKGMIVVDRHLRTTAGGIYAIGDVKPGMKLAHTASHEGMVAVRNALGEQVAMDYRVVPSAIFTRPEIGTVGLTERQAREAGHDVKVGRFHYQGCGKALAMGEPEGMVKIVADRRYGEILGVHIIGAHASDLVHEGTLAMAAECDIGTLAEMIHAHPTLAEAVMEAALDCDGMCLHAPPRNKK